MNTNSIGERIKNVRIEKGISQSELAEKIHISASTLCRWEKGLVEPSFESIHDISTALNISIESILGLSPKTEHSKKRNKWHKILAIPLLLIPIAFSIYLFIPKYRVVSSNSYYVNEQGETIVIKAIPVKYYNEKEALSYCKSIKEKYTDLKKYDAVEVWIISDVLTIDDIDDAYLVYTFLLEEIEL
jgi:transcriptional regulator with XRE-family HTH domain